MLWKIYFWTLILIAIPSYLYNFYIGLNRFWEFFDILLFGISLVGLFGFSWRKGILFQQLWQILFWTSIGWNIIYHYFIPIPIKSIEYFPLNLSQKVLATINLIPFIPIFFALFIYAFKKPEIWNKQK